MRWRLENPEAIKARRMYLDRGLVIPDELHPPFVPLGYEAWLEAFWELSTDRQLGGGVGPIPSNSIRSWPVASGEAERFRRCMRAMDQAFLAHVRPDDEVAPLSIDAFRDAAEDATKA